MAKLLVAYYSRSGHTQHMAETIAEAAAAVDGCTVDCTAVAALAVKTLPDYDGIILGSPTYYGTMAAEVKQLIDASVAFHGKLQGKVAGAFASSANVGGGNETTVLDLLKAMLIHGMIVPGAVKGDHYGPVSVGDVDSRSRAQCGMYGTLVAELTVRLHG